MKDKPNAGMVHISATVPVHIRDGLRDRGGGNLSEGLRRCLSEPPFGPSGAAWITHPVQLPNPLECDGPLVLALPQGVLAHGIGACSILIDMETGELSFLRPEGGVSSEFSLSALALLAGKLPPAVVACCAPDPADEFGQAIGCGLHLTRLRHGLIEVRAAGPQGADCAVAMPIRQALQWTAEVVALLARRVELQQLQVTELNNLAARSEQIGQEEPA